MSTTRFVYLIWKRILLERPPLVLPPGNTYYCPTTTVALPPPTHTHRTVLDLLISVGHVVAIAADLKRQNDPAREYTCSVLGGFNTFTLMASNMWYLVLAVDLAKAIRNPFK